MTSSADKLASEIERIKKGGTEKYHARNREQKKLFVRDRLKLLLDDGKIEFEDGMFAECLNPELPSDGNITGVGRIHGRPVAFSASDSTVKAGSAGEKSVQKNLRIQEMAMQMRIPMFYLIDSAGARTEMVTREKVTLEEMGGARMHCTVSGLGDFLAANEEDAIHIAREYFKYMPQNYLEKPAGAEPAPPASDRPLRDIVPEVQSKAFNMYDFINSLADGGSFFEVKKLFAPELITGFARLNGRAVGIVANQPRVKGGVIFTDSSDKGKNMRYCAQVLRRGPLRDGGTGLWHRRCNCAAHGADRRDGPRSRYKCRLYKPDCRDA